MNPFLRRKRNVGDSGRKSEKHTAKRLGGRCTVASGAIDGDKGDIDTGNFLIECKSTTANSLGIKLDYLEKIRGEALAIHKYPALAFTFTTGNGRPRKGGQWVAIPESLFKSQFG